MASLYNNKISTTYVGLIKTIDNAVISASLRELSDGSGNATGLYVNTAGDFKVTSILEFGSLKDTGEGITITKFVDEADGIANNDNDTTIPTSAAVVDYVASRITLEDLDFSGDSGTGSVDLDSQVFAIVGTTNEIETSGGSQQLQIGLPTNITIAGTTTFGGNLIGNTNIILKDTSDNTLAAFYSGGKGEIYFNNSKKFETTSDGATVTGGLTATGGSVFTGATFSSNVSWADSAEAAWGADEDFTISHIAGDNYLSNDIGNLYIRQRANDGDILFQNDDGSGGTTEYFKLDGSVADGTWTYTTWVDYGTINLGNDRDLQLYHNSTDSHIINKTGDLYIKNQSDDKNIIFQTDDNSGGITEYFRIDGLNAINQFSKETFLIDNVKLRFGTGGDLNIYHDGSNSYIDEVGTGSLYIKSAGAIRLQSDTGENMILCTNDAGVTLYHNNSNKFGTTATGVTVTGTIVADGIDLGDDDKARFGTGNDLEIYHSGSHSYIDETGTGGLILRTGDFYLRNPSDAEMIYATSGGAVTLYHNNSSKLSTSATGIAVTGGITTDGASTFSSSLDVTGIITADGGLNLNDNDKIKVGTSQDLEIYHNGSNSFIQDTGTGLLVISTNHLQVYNAAVSEFMITAEEDGAVSLYYDSSKKLETTSAGVTITGDVVATGYVDASTGVRMESGQAINFIDTNLGFNSIFRDTTNGGLVINTGGNPALAILDNTNATFSNNLIVSGDLTVNGTTTTVNTDHFNVEDPLISMAKDNAANTVDIGTYGRYNDGTQRYLGLFSDASDSNRYKLFKGLTVEPTTTVDTSGTGYEYADLLLAGLEARGNVTVVNGGVTLTQGYGLNLGVSGYDIKMPTSTSLALLTAATAALTLDNSQNATFAGDVSLGDAKKLKFGAATDFEIYHNNTTNVNHISSLLDRQLSINGNIIKLTNQANSTTYLELDSSGNATFAGDVSLAAGALSITADGSNAVTFTESGNGLLTIAAPDDIILDAVSDIVLDAGGADVRFKDGGTEFGRINNNASGNFLFLSPISDKDIIFKGNDGGSEITALTLDMSSAGSATFNNDVTITGTTYVNNVQARTAAGLKLGNDDNSGFVQVVDNGQVNFDSGNSEIHLKGSGTTFGKFYVSGGDFYINNPTQDEDIIFNGNDGGSSINALTLDMSNGGSATFRDDIDFGGKLTQTGTGANTFAGMITVNGAGIDIDNDDDIRLRFDNASTFKAGLQVATSGNDMISGSDVNDFCIRAEANMLFATGGNTERLRIDSSGNVGIGTSDIDFELQVGGTDVSGTANFDAQFAVLSEATTGYPSGFIFKAPRVATSSNRVLLYEDFETYFSMQVHATSTAGAQSDIPIVLAPQGGNVGIGTASPESLLAVKGASTAADLFSVSDIGVPTSGAEYGTAMIKTGYAGYALNITNYSGAGKGLRVYTTGDTQGEYSLYCDQAGTAAFVVDAIGKVGIGTDTPTNLLTINDPSANGSITDTIPSWWGLVIDRAYTTSSTAAMALIGGTVATGSTGRLHLGNSDDVDNTYIDGGANQMHFSVSGSTALTINTDGDVGVGVGAPSRRLDVRDSSDSQNTILAYNQGASFTGTVYEAITDRASNSAFNLMNLKASTVSKFLVRGDGNVGIGNSDPSALLTMKDAAYVQEWDRAKGFYQYTTQTGSAAGDFDISTVINTHNLRGLAVDYYESGHYYNNGGAYYFRHSRVYIMVEGTNLRVGDVELIKSSGNTPSAIVAAPTVTASGSNEATIVSTILSGYTHYLSVDVVGSGFESFENVG